MAAQAKAITVLYDGTEPARRALDAAARLAGYGSTLTVIGVAQNGGGPGRAAPPSDLAGAVRNHLARRQVLAQYVDAGDAPERTIRRLTPDLLVVGRESYAATLVEAAAGSSTDVLLVA